MGDSSTIDASKYPGAELADTSDMASIQDAQVLLCMSLHWLANLNVAACLLTHVYTSRACKFMHTSSTCIFMHMYTSSNCKVMHVHTSSHLAL